MTSIPYCSIAFVARPESRLLMLDVVEELRCRYGAKIHLFCFVPQEMALYEALNVDDAFASVTDAEVLLSSTRTTNLDETEVFSRAAKIEKGLPRTYNSVSVANRHLGRGYAQGGFYHPRSRFSEETEYVQMVHAYNETFSFWENAFQSLDIDLVINGTIEAAVVSRKIGIPFRSLASSRYKNFHFWAVNEFLEDPGIAPRLEAFFESSTEPIATLEPYYAHTVNRTSFIKRGMGIVPMIRNIGMQIARHMYWRIRGYAKARSYYLSSEISYYYRMWAHFRHLSKLTRPLEVLRGKSFVFFPLHLEPEAALQSLSPEFFFQLSSITALSRDLPTGTLLAVKETFAGIGRRPDNFYEQIADLKNVVILDTLELGTNVVKEAATVATINGTAGLEAALLGKPVIVFGQHNNYDCLPHVRRVESLTDLRQVILVSLSASSEVLANANTARRYLDVVLERSFDLGDYDYLKVSKFSSEVVAAAAKALHQSVCESAVSSEANWVAD